MRPRWRMPIPVAFGIVLAAWIVRSVLRDGDFGLDIPQDLIALGAVTIGAGAVWMLRRSHAADDPHDDAAHHNEHDEYGGTDQSRDPYDI